MSAAGQPDPISQPIQVAVSLLTAGVVTEPGLSIVVDIVEELSREQLLEVVVALVGLTSPFLTDQNLRSIGGFVA